MMTIVYASDKNYAALTSISAVSALRHNPGAQIVLLGYNLEVDAREIVRSRVEKSGGVFEYHDVSKTIERLKTDGCSGYTSYAAYARIFAADVMPDRHGRILYLDCDTLVNGSLDPLFEMDMKGCPLALGFDCIPQAYNKFIGNSARLPYFNTGVMLISLDAWREHACRDRILADLMDRKWPNPLADQDVIVRCFSGETVPLSPRWNFLSQFFLVSYDAWHAIVGSGLDLPCSANEYVKARNDAAIYHFSGHTLGRPWYTSSRHPMREEYRRAAAAADLADVAEQTRSMLFDYKVQYWLYRLLPQKCFDVVCRWLYRINIWRNYHV